MKAKRSILLFLGILLSISLACNNLNSLNNQTTNSITISQAEIPENNTLNLPPHQDLRIVVISDLNSQYGSTEYEPEVDKAISLIPQLQADLVLCGGDMIAGQKKTLATSQIKAMWSAFNLHIAQPLRQAKIPFGFTIGNHDGSGAIVAGKSIFERERKLAAAYWNNRNNNSLLNIVDRANFPFHYTFQQKNVFFLVWDASTAYLDQQQLAWVEQSLSSQEARQANMRFAIGHLPLYPVAEQKNKPGEYLAEADKLRLLLEKYQVHTYISGHHHAYYPGRKQQLQLLNAGALGQGARQLIDSNLPPRQTITLVDLNLTSTTASYTTYDIQTLEVIDITQLPPGIQGKNGRIIRQDLATEDLN